MKKSKNPFLSGKSLHYLVIKKSDNSVYNQLYKLDIKAELGDYSLPFGEEDDKRKTKVKDGPLNSSQVTSKYGNEEPSEGDYEKDEH
jgi:hypothetical protein